MTEKEILQQQEANGQTAFYLMAVGMFYHAYGCGAFALARATSYRVLRKQRKRGDVLVCGFPASQLDTVLQCIREAGGEVEPAGEKTFLFRGLDGTPDETMVAEAKSPVATSSQVEDSLARASFSWLVDAVLSFNSRCPPDGRNEPCSIITEKNQGGVAGYVSIYLVPPCGHFPNFLEMPLFMGRTALIFQNRFATSALFCNFTF